MKRVTHADVVELARRAAFASQPELADFLFKVAGRVCDGGTLVGKRDRWTGEKVAAVADRTMLMDFLGE